MPGACLPARISNSAASIRRRSAASSRGAGHTASVGVIGNTSVTASLLPYTVACSAARKPRLIRRAVVAGSDRRTGGSSGHNNRAKRPGTPRARPAARRMRRTSDGSLTRGYTAAAKASAPIAGRPMLSSAVSSVSLAIKTTCGRGDCRIARRIAVQPVWLRSATMNRLRSRNRSPYRQPTSDAATGTNPFVLASRASSRMTTRLPAPRRPKSTAIRGRRPPPQSNISPSAGTTGRGISRKPHVSIVAAPPMGSSDPRG